MKKLLLGMGVFALATVAVKAQFNPCVAYSVTNCSPPPSVALAPVDPITLSVCETVSASTTMITNTGKVVVTSIEESCNVITNTIATNYPTIVSNWTVVYWNSQWTTNAGLSASFAPTNTGSGTITFYAKYTTPNPCVGAHTTNRIVSVTVTNCAPLILTQPANQTVIAGNSATFNVSACGAALSYQWRFNGATLPGATASSFTTNNVQAASAGTYAVVITNSLGSVTSTNAVLTVLVPPTIITQPVSQTLAQGSNATFNVVADGSAPLSYQWRFNGVSLPGATASSFTTNNVQTGSAGTYTVVISNSAGSVTSTNAVLTVLVPPTITTQPASQTVAQGSNATFNVVADGSAPLSYQWRINGAILPGATASSFTTNNVQAGSAGTYTVVITNSAGSVTSTNAVLTVLVPPTVTTQPVSQTVALGSSASFNVVVAGTAPLSYQWRFNGANLPGATGSLLALNNVQVPDIGSYSVVVTNLAGAVTSSIATLDLTCAPPPSGLVAWWPAEGNANDIIGGHDGALRGNATANATGQVGKAFSFDGTNDFVQIPDSFAFHPTNFTIETWVRFDAMDSAGSGGSPAQDQYIVFKQNTRYGNFEGFDLSKTSDKFRIVISSASGSTVVVNSTNHISTNVWYHLAGVRGSNYLQLYVNGQLHGQAAVSFTQDYGPWSLFFGSSGQSYWDHKLKGSLDEVGLFNRALSASEIQAIYSAGAFGKCSPPPSVTLLTPSDGARFWAPDQIALAATAYSPDRGITNVEFFANGTRIGQSATPTNGLYTCPWTNPAPGAFALIAVAHDGGLALTSSVANVSVDTGATFVKGINLNGPSVVIESNSWLSYTQALASGLSVSTNATPGVNTNITPLVPAAAADVPTMLQTFLRRFRFPPSQQQATNPPHFRPTRDDSFASASYFTVTLSNVPAGLMVSNTITYRGWCADHEHGIQPDEPCILYSVGDPFLDSDPRYHGKNLNKLNYLINHKSCTHYMEVQNAIWSLLGQGLDQNYLTPNFTAMTNDAHLHGGNFIPAPDDISLVLCNDSTNDQPVVIEIGGRGSTNHPVSFTLSQSGLTNGYYYVALYLVENLTNYARSLDFLVQDVKVATQVGTELPYRHWAKYGAFGANVTNGMLKVEVSSPAKGDPLLMGLAIYSAVTPLSVSITWPTNGAVFVSPQVVPIAANVTPATGVQMVQFFTNSLATEIGRDVLSSDNPYKLDWFVSQPGDYTLLAKATSVGGTAVSATGVVIHAVAPVRVNPGTNRVVVFSGSSVTITQYGTVTGGTAARTSRWDCVQGPNVDFSSRTSAVTAMSFTNSGTRILRLSAGDGLSEHSATVEIQVLINQAPVVVAGPDRTVPWSPGAFSLLSATASDDGLLPGTPLTVSWTNLTGGATVLNPTSLDATATTFASNGVYNFEIVADDGMLKGTGSMQVVVAPAGSRTWTFDADFEEGALLNVNYDDVPDQLQLNRTIEPFPYVWVACSDRGTIVRIDVNTGQVLGEYRTTPETILQITGNPSPSRTTVDKHGNVWVGNRFDNGPGKGSVTRVGLVIGGTRGDRVTNGNDIVVVPNPTGEYLQPPFKYCTAVDRDHDGLIRTSFGLTNVLRWDDGWTNYYDGGVSYAEDECIMNYTRVYSITTRTVAVDTNNDVWVGGYDDRRFEKIDGRTGEPILGTATNFDCGGYGGLVDRYGRLWSSDLSYCLLRYDPAVPSVTNIASPGNYGLGIDPLTGEIWHTENGSTVTKISPSGQVVSNYYHGDNHAQGVAVDARGNVWVAHAKVSVNPFGNSVGHLRTDGAFIGNVELGCAGGANGPTGVAIDSNGKVWVTCYDTAKAMRIDPDKGPRGQDGIRLGAVDLVVDLGTSTSHPMGAAGPYNYSDMTGFIAVGETAPSGTWTVYHDSGVEDMPWGLISWNGVTNSDTGLKVEVRAATNYTALNATNTAFLTVTNGEVFTGCGVTGRVVEIRVSFWRAGGSTNTPALKDLTLMPAGAGVAVANEIVSQAVSDRAGVIENSSSNLVDVLANDPIAANASARIVSWSAPRHGAAFTNSATVLSTNVYNVVHGYAPGRLLYYTPNPGFSGTDRFTYAATDGAGSWGRAIVQVTVSKANRILDINDLAQPQPDFYEVSKNSRTNFFEVLTNDVNSVSLVGFTQPPNGLVERHPCGLLFTPNPGFTGTNIFTYTAASGAGGRGTTNVTVVVTNVDLPNLEILLGTNRLEHGATILISVTGTGVSVTNTLTLTNSGSAPIPLDTWEILPTGGAFTNSDPSPNFNLTNSCATNVSVVFRADAPGLTNGLLLIQTNGNSNQKIEIHFAAMVSSGSGPTITLDSPYDGAEFSGYSDIALAASISSGNATNVVFVFETTEGMFKIAEDAAAPYGATWHAAPPGSYALRAYAFDANNHVGRSDAVGIVVHDPPPMPTNALPTPHDDYLSLPLLVSGTTNYAVDVLANDTDPNHDPLTIVDYTEYGELGRVTKLGSLLYYSPLAGRFGADVILYTVSDGRGGAATARLLVNISSNVPPTVRIISPTNNFGRLPASLLFKATASAGVTNVTYYDRGRAIGASTNAATFYPVIWLAQTNLFAGQSHVVVAVATDTNGLQGYSQAIVIEVVAPEWDVPPVAEILNFAPDPLDSRLEIEPQLPVVREAITNVIGTVGDTAEDDSFGPDPVSYKVLLYDKTGTLVGDFTPGPTNALGYCTTPGTNITLATLNLSGLENGVYQVELVANDTWYEFSTRKSFILDSQLKIGHFSFSVRDLVIPVNGIPLTVVRSYNSLHPELGAFGPCWSLALNDMDVRINEQRLDVVDDDGDIVNLRIGGGYDVSLTLPDARRTTFAFDAPLNSLGNGTPVWSAPPSVKDELTALGSPRFAYLSLMGPNWQAHGWPCYILPHFDFPGWELKTKDGTRYVIEREPLGEHDFNGAIFLGGGEEEDPLDDPTPLNGTGSIGIRVYGQPRLARIIQRSGDTIEITPNGIFHKAQGTNTTRSIPFERDSQGRITAVWDPNSGLTNYQAGTINYQLFPPAVQYLYHPTNGNLIEVKKLVDRTAGLAGYQSTFYEYTNARWPHLITTIIDPRGIHVARSFYDTNGVLTAVVDADGKTNHFFYSANRLVEVTIDRSGYTNTLVRDPRGNLTAITNEIGRVTRMGYNDSNQRTAQTNAFGTAAQSWTTFGYDENGFPSGVTNMLSTNLFFYSPHGELLTNVNALRHVTRFEYDDKGNRTKMVDALNNKHVVVFNDIGKPSAIVDPLDRINATASYDGMGNLTVLSNSFTGVATSFDYDPNGNPLGTSNRWVNPDNPADVRVITNRYVLDATGREVATTDSNGKQTSVDYNEIGSPNLVTDAYEKTTEYLYDARANPTQITHSDGRVSRMVYDAEGRLAVTDESHFPGQVVNGTRSTYNGAGQVVKSERLTNVVIRIVTAEGVSRSEVASVGGVLGESTYGYDEAGRQTAVTNAFGAVTRYEFDSLGRQTAVVDALTNRTDYVFDGAGRMTFMTNALRRVTQYEYDELGRLKRTIYPDNTVTATRYNELGQRLAETNQLLLVTDFEYYPENGLLQRILKPAVFAPESNAVVRPRIEFEYDDYGQLKLVRDPKERPTHFTSDHLGRPWKHKLPLNQEASQAYDEFGRLWRKVDFKGQTNEFLYDSAGRLRTNHCFAAGSSVPAEAMTYLYDAQDRIKEIATPHGTDSFDYDGQGRVNRVSSPEGVINYEYEPLEGRRVRTYTANNDVRYDYDLLGRLKTVTVVKRNGNVLPVQEVTTNTYTALGTLEHVYYPNGVHAFYEYNLVNRLTNLTYFSGSGQLLAQYRYTVNAAGHWEGATEVHLAAGGGHSTNWVSWHHDNLGRLTNETCSSTAAGLNYTNWYVYDLAGNRLWRTNVSSGGAEAIAYTYNDNDQLLEDGPFTSLYDANGALTNRTSSTETNAYSYNLRNRLNAANVVRAEGGNGVSLAIEYAYNPAGIRTRKVVTGTINETNLYVNDPYNASGFSQLLEALPAPGISPRVSYVVGGRVISQEKAGLTSHLLSDGHGSTRMLLSTNGTVEFRFSYDAYGRAVGFSTEAVNPPQTALLYSGEPLDAGLQQYDQRARTYDPNLGRFNQIDPFSGNQQSARNLYAYCADDPINSSDPSGLYDIDVHRYLSEFLAEKANFDHDDSVAIGRAALQPDIDRAAGFGLFYGANNANWHFVTRLRVRNLANGIHGTNAPHFFTAVGDFLHAQEDSYGHCKGELDRDWINYGGGNGGLFGHGLQGHYPDFTFWRPAKAMRMAERIYADLKHINLSGGHYDDAPDLATENGAPALDAATAKKVKIFLEYPEKPDDAAGSGAYVTETFGGFNLTRQSMLNKIRLLFPLPDPIKDAPGSMEAGVLSKFPNVPGHKFGTYRSFYTPRGGEIMMGASPFGY